MSEYQTLILDCSSFVSLSAACWFSLAIFIRVLQRNIYVCALQRNIYMYLVEWLTDCDLAHATMAVHQWKVQEYRAVQCMRLDVVAGLQYTLKS